MRVHCVILYRYRTKVSRYEGSHSSQVDCYVNESSSLDGIVSPSLTRSLYLLQQMTWSWREKITPGFPTHDVYKKDIVPISCFLLPLFRVIHRLH